MKTKLIEIQVRGFTGDGKTNVCAVIRDALIDAYHECLDMAVYLKQAIIERDSAK